MLNLILDQVAKASGLDGPRLSRIEHGYLTPTPEQLEKIAKALRISVHDLTEGSQPRLMIEPKKGEKS